MNKNQQPLLKESQATTRISEFSIASTLKNSQKKQKSRVSKFQRSEKVKIDSEKRSRSKHSRQKSNESFSQFFIKQEVLRSSTPEKFSRGSEHLLLKRINCQIQPIPMTYKQNEKQIENQSSPFQDKKFVFSSGNSRNKDTQKERKIRNQHFLQEKQIFGKESLLGQGEINLMLKKMIFYKEKCQKLSIRLKQSEIKSQHIEELDKASAIQKKEACCCEVQTKRFKENLHIKESQVNYLQAENYSLKLALSRSQQNQTRLEQSTSFLESLVQELKRDLHSCQETISRHSLEVMNLRKAHEEQTRALNDKYSQQVNDIRNRHSQLLNMVKGQKMPTKKDLESKEKKAGNQNHKSSILIKSSHNPPASKSKVQIEGQAQCLRTNLHMRESTSHRLHIHCSEIKYENISRVSKGRSIDVLKETPDADRSGRSDSLFAMDLTPEKQ